MARFPLAPGRLAPIRSATTRLGLGLAAVARPGYINLGRADDLPGQRTAEALEARCRDLLDAAAQAGVGYIDVARSYGRAEEFLARWLDERAPDAAPRPVVGSKWGYRYTAGWRVDAPLHEEKEHSPEHFAAQLVESRRLLGDRLDLYQVHSATIESGALADARLLAAMVEARRRGAYRALGITLSGPRSRAALDLAIAARVDGERVFDVVNATLNLLEPSLDDGLAAARDEGLGVIAKEVHANGRLTPVNDRPADRVLRRTLAAIAARAGTTIDGLALALVAARPYVDIVLSGAATTRQFASHRDAIGLVLPAGLADEVRHLAEPPATYWAVRATLPWN